jgi:hypothetical protein
LFSDLIFRLIFFAISAKLSKRALVLIITIPLS